MCIKRGQGWRFGLCVSSTARVSSQYDGSVGARIHIGFVIFIIQWSRDVTEVGGRGLLPQVLKSRRNSTFAPRAEVSTTYFVVEQNSKKQSEILLLCRSVANHFLRGRRFNGKPVVLRNVLMRPSLFVDQVFFQGSMPCNLIIQAQDLDFYRASRGGSLDHLFRGRRASGETNMNHLFRGRRGGDDDEKVVVHFLKGPENWLKKSLVLEGKKLTIISSGERNHPNLRRRKCKSTQIS